MCEPENVGIDLFGLIRLKRAYSGNARGLDCFVGIDLFGLIRLKLLVQLAKIKFAIVSGLFCLD